MFSPKAQTPVSIPILKSSSPSSNLSTNGTKDSCTASTTTATKGRLYFRLDDSVALPVPQPLSSPSSAFSSNSSSPSSSLPPSPPSPCISPSPPSVNIHLTSSGSAVSATASTGSLQPPSIRFEKIRTKFSQSSPDLFSSSSSSNPKVTYRGSAPSALPCPPPTSMEQKNRPRAGTSPKITVPVNTSRSLPNSPPQADSVLGSPPKGSPPSPQSTPFTYGLIPTNLSASSLVATSSSSSKIDVSQLQGNGLAPEQRKTRVVKPVSAPSPPRTPKTSSSPPSDSLLSSPPRIAGDIVINQSGNLSKLRAQSRSVGNIPLVTGSFRPITRSARSNSSGNDSADDDIPGPSNHSGRNNSNPGQLVALLDALSLDVDDRDDDQPVTLSNSQVRFQRDVLIPELSLSTIEQEGSDSKGGSLVEFNHRKEKPPTKRFALSSKGEERRATPITPRSGSGTSSGGSTTSKEGERPVPTTPTSSERSRKYSSSGRSTNNTTSPPATPTGKSKGTIMPALTGLYSSINNLSLNNLTSPITSPVVSPRGETSPPTSPLLRRNPTFGQLNLSLSNSNSSIKLPAAPAITDVLTQYFRKSLITSDGTLDISLSDLPQTPQQPQQQQQQYAILKGATFPKLVEWMLFYLSGEDDTNETEIRSFLCTYREFASPTTLFKLVAKYFRVYCRAKSETQKANRALNIFQARLKKRVSAFLKLWLENWYDLDIEGKPLATRMVNFIDSHIPSEERTVIKLLLVRKNFDAYRRKTTKDVLPSLLPNQIDKDNAWLTDTSSRDIAEQLTLLEVELFQAIKPSELIDCSWSKGNADKVSPNLLLAVSRFNQISLWVTTSIVTAGKSDRQALLLKKFITIAKRLYDLKNWNGVMEITSGIGNCAVTRLRKATRLLGPKHKELWTKLENVTAPTSNYKNYRVLSKELPSLPILAVVQRDIFFMYEGNPDYLPASNGTGTGDLINVDKMRMVGSTIQDFIHHVQRNAPSANIAPKKKIRKLLKNAPFLTNEAAYQQSLICEPSQATPATIWDDDNTTSPRNPGANDMSHQFSSEDEQSRSRHPSEADIISWPPKTGDLIYEEDTPMQPMESDSSFCPFEISPFTSPRKD